MSPHEPRIGVYICHCGQNIAGKVDVEDVAAFAGSLQHVSLARHYQFMCSDQGQDMIISDVVNQGLNRVVVASCSPRMHQATFAGACARAGLNPYLLHMANIREGAAWVSLDGGQATRKARSLLAAAVLRVQKQRRLQTSRIGVKKSVLVIGGGIAGMQAALTAAESGYKAVLVEKEPSIGGQMAKLDKTFPTLDCAACIMTPKMASVANHPDITLHTWSELESLEGFVGNYKARIRKKPRYVDADKCTGCGQCMEKCPVKKIPSAFQERLGYRSAIYTPFPQAVPSTPVVDPKRCRFLLGKSKVAVCTRFCPAEALDFQQQPEIVEEEAGAIILATGFELYNPKKLSQYGFGRYREVYTSLQFERLNNATGPTQGQIQTRDGQNPQRVGIIHCVGSRDKNHKDYCSRVCCMYSLKFAHLIKEKTGAEVYSFYIDMRTPGKNYEEFYNRIQAEGIRLVRGRVAEVTDVPDNPEDAGRLMVVAENTLSGKVLRIPMDMVILSPAMVPATGAVDTARMAGVSWDSHGWLTEQHPKLAPVSTQASGVFVAGCSQGPRDIPDTVAQASAAAGEAVALLSRGWVSTLAERAVIDQDICSGCALCARVCPYGAVSIQEESRTSMVNEALCRGCGSCAAACPSGAAEVEQFAPEQIFSEITGILHADKIREQRHEHPDSRA